MTKREMKTGMDIFYDRRSVRLYTEEKIPDEDIDKIIRAGFYAPTAVNKQETDFIVVKLIFLPITSDFFLK
jgi:nitroreductase